MIVLHANSNNPFRGETKSSLGLLLGFTQADAQARLRLAAKQSRNQHSRPGITLIEILVALAIFLLALGAITRLIDIGSENAIDAVHQSDGVRLAQSKMAEIEAGVIPPDSGSSGSFDLEPGWNWQMNSEPASIPNLYSITVTVTHDTGRSAKVVLSQMVMDPRMMGKPGEIPKPTTTTDGTTTTSTGTSP